MPKTRITKRAVDALESAAAEFVLWDTDLAGFGVRVRPTGAKSYVVQYRTGGRNTPVRKVTLGTVAKLTAEEARTAAKRILAGAELGRDEAADRAKARAEMSVMALCRHYLNEGTDHLKPRSRQHVVSHVENHIEPLLGSKRVSDVTAADIEALQRAVANGKTARDEPTDKKRGRRRVTGGRTVAGAVVRSLSTIMSFAVARKIRVDNPALGVRKFKPGVRERYLSAEELGRLGDAIREAEAEGIETAGSSRSKHAPKSLRVRVGPHVAAAFRLLILTGARLREVLHLRWSEVDIERGVLFLSDSKTGRKTIILNAPAVGILSALPRLGSFVIAGDTAGQHQEKPRSDLKRPWALVTARAGLEGLRIHDLRHTHASFGAATGVGLPIIGKLLGHTQVATTARYAHLADDPLRKAAEQIGSDLARAMGGPGENV
jgi:integrase